MRILVSLLALVGALSCRSTPTPAVERPFDGVGLTGWVGDLRYWRVEDGSLIGESTEALPCPATTYLVWNGPDVEDFELSFEFRIRGGNSGVQFRSRRGAGLEVLGYQADMDAAGEWTGGLYEQGG